MTNSFSYFLFAALLLTSSLHAQNLNDNTALLGRLAPQGLNGYNDVWGYAANGREYAIMGHFRGTSIIDVTTPTQPREVAFIAGPSSIWRDIKTHGHYAYVTNETAEGLHIIDLQNLPNSAELAARHDRTFRTAHNLYIDNGYAYIAGSNTARGCNILSLSNPLAPVEVGQWNSNYWHDVIVKNDTIYGSAMGGPNGIDIVEGRNKAQLRLISRTPFPGAFTHNIWMSEDNNYISQTDEVWDQPVKFWDVTDHTAPELLATYTAGPGAIPHNTHIRGNFAFISYYYDGLKIVDISERRAPQEVANWDTYPDDNLQRGRGYEGAWGAYPFLPSGRVLVSDRKYGLAVVEFNNTRAGYLTGAIKNASDGSALPDVYVEVTNRFAGEGQSSTLAQKVGEYFVSAKPGARSFKFSKFGFEDFYLSDFTIAPGVTHVREVALVPKPVLELQVNVKLRDGLPLANARVIIKGVDVRYEIKTTTIGAANLALPLGNYEITLREWGYVPVSITHAHNHAVPAINFTTEPGYVETFTDAEEWSTKAARDESFQEWVIDAAAKLPYGNRLPSIDHTGDGIAAISRARSGASTLTSPKMSAASLTNPHVQFARFYNPFAWATAQAHDTLQVWLSNNEGLTWKLLAAFTAIDHDWRVLSYRVADFLAPTAAMRVKFVNLEAPDATPGASAYAMIDDVKLISESTLIGNGSNNAPPTSLHVLPNFPNPFNPSTKISWQQEGLGHAEIFIYNVMGQRVATFRTSDVSSGLREYEIALGNHASGMYLYQVRVNGVASEIKKMLLAK